MTQMADVGFVLWFTGLPASGKTTLARSLSKQLAAQNIATQLLDSDLLRRQLTPQPAYTPTERDWFYNTVIFLAELLADNGVNVLIAATAPRRAYREAARFRLSRFAEIYVECSPETCRARDPKGLWQRADKGEITSLPGAGTEYEPPPSPEIRVNTDQLSIETAVAQIVSQLKEQGFFL